MNITELCVNCKQNNSCTMCWKTSNKKCPHFIQKTNADRIRDMSDEELAKLIAENAYTGACSDFGIPYNGKCCGNCEKCDAIINWLKQPVE